ncbi:MAG: Fpg/Nei family DNA glycosylase, partial [Actinomycetales bacterium]
MPEGHTLHRLAGELTEAFGGRVVRSSSPQGRFDAGATRLDGRRLTEATARGK